MFKYAINTKCETGGYGSVVTESTRKVSVLLSGLELSQNFLKNQTRMHSHFLFSAVAGVCIVSIMEKRF